MGCGTAGDSRTMASLYGSFGILHIVQLLYGIHAVCICRALLSGCILWDGETKRRMVEILRQVCRGFRFKRRHLSRGPYSHGWGQVKDIAKSELAAGAVLCILFCAAIGIRTRNPLEIQNSLLRQMGAGELFRTEQAASAVTQSGPAETVFEIRLNDGVQLLCVGILGQYLARTYMEVKKRPVYILKENSEEEQPEEAGSDF